MFYDFDFVDTTFMFIMCILASEVGKSWNKNYALNITWTPSIYFFKVEFIAVRSNKFLSQTIRLSENLTFSSRKKDVPIYWIDKFEIL